MFQFFMPIFFVSTALFTISATAQKSGYPGYSSYPSNSSYPARSSYPAYSSYPSNSSYPARSSYPSSNPSNSGQKSPDTTTSAAEYRVVAKYMAQFVYELKQQFYVWHWFNSEGDTFWGSEFKSNNEAGFEYLQINARDHWQNLCSIDNSQNPKDCDFVDSQSRTAPGYSNVYGPGFYAAIDPATTRDYGFRGGSDSWVLAQVRLPKEFRILDLVKDGSTEFSPAIQQYFLKLGCNERMNNLEKLFKTNIFYNVSPACSLAVRHLFKDSLKVDAFMYGYGASNFSGCHQSTPVKMNADSLSIGGYQGPFSQRALVIMNTQRLLKPEDVKVFNKHSKDAIANRKMIQGIFDFSRAGLNLWSDIPAGSAPEQGSVFKWLQNHIIGCENAPPYRAVPLKK